MCVYNIYIYVCVCIYVGFLFLCVRIKIAGFTSHIGSSQESDQALDLWLPLAFHIGCAGLGPYLACGQVPGSSSV